LPRCPTPARSTSKAPARHPRAHARDLPGRHPTGFGGEKNPPIFVYDCSGPYTDPAARIDIRSGLPALRQRWIEERGDTEVLPDLSSEFGRARAADPKLDELRFPGLHRKPRRAKAGANVSQMHYARQGIITPRWSSSPSART
jgi:phosphomethylpyrimidine synthase